MRPAILLLLFLSTLKSYSYPIFYQCEDSKITYKGKFNDSDIFEQLIKMEKSKRESQIESWCQDSAECMRDLKLIVDMAGSSFGIAKSLFLEKVKEIQNDFESKNLPIQDLENLNKLKDAYSMIRACQETKNTLVPDDFLSKSQQSVLTPYPYYSNYMYATGCNGVDSETCSPISKNELDRVIKEAVLMGVDPYLVISFSLMEGGTGEVGRLYLDPIGVMGAMGCSSHQVSNGTSTEVALNSFGTSYIVNSQTVKNPQLQNKLKKYFQEFNLDKSQGNSFYCYETRGKSDSSVFEKPQANSCCVELGFKTSKKSDEQIKHALTYHFIDNITKNSFRGNQDPAWRAQRYNGYTDLMGAAEGVSPWRAGVNYYKNPAYGYQTMDFVINALMFNPYISNKVDEVSKEFDQDWESILCKGKKDGSYYIDSDYYFDKHKESPRLEEIYDKFKRGITFNGLTSREKKVLIAEMEETALQNSKVPDRLPKYREDRLYYKLQDQLRPQDYEGEFRVFEYTTLSKEAWKKEILGKHNLTGGELDALYVFEIKNKSAATEYDNISKRNNELYTQATKICQTIEDNDKLNSCYREASKLQISVYGNSNEKTISLPSDSLLIKVSSQFKQLANEMAELDKSEEIRQGEFLRKYNYLQNKAKSVELAIQSIEQVESIDNALARFKSSDKFNETLEQELRTYHSSLTNKTAAYAFNEAYKEYFKNIYPQRNTLSKSSVYPWRKFSDQEAEKIIKLYQSL